ncbi:Adenylosuccinate synthetase [Sulfobacillus thermosulfidooxidans DSM 9293]|uniref:Adenylosuccinate synthetase n=2 Tax=Sulfobacillus thermosulfidooxidans TaxID=28034 RepID=A0A1W1WKX7_SULTA|nr:adenylosuccinate synthase [Sulfobacillus thermosulfidooxidans]PSR27712.1 MAG: adenylosuccinate synthase [Sulfobacillus thermosulfidooxidans]SMC06670.1 Adenylosuccinate synthetase [Sulfobacillus thermosulfidooxidans DSM 9293]
MTVTAVVGANWGDEGKGKITDYLARNMDFVVRFQGGSNAGHTILNEFGKFALHMLPSGVFYPHVHNVLGPGVALNTIGLAEELQNLKDRGIVPSHLHISDRAQVILPVHMLLDQAEEMRLGANQFGSTRSGIAPFYADKFLKIGVQVADLFVKDRLAQRIERNLALKNFLLPTAYQLPIQDPHEITELVSHHADAIAPYVCDTTSMLHEALNNNRAILLEGQLGALRDPDHGIYPFTTSSSPLAGFASVGAGLPPYSITRIIAVTKAYSTCVGAGPFVTELHGQDADVLRARGGDAGEYGATTGRPRRVGWFDAVATRYGCMIQGATEVALTNLDVLSYLDNIPIATAYALDDNTITQFPPTAELSQAQPVFEEMPGWRTDITNIRHYEDLPQTARQYVERIEALIDTKIRYISVGPQREQIVVKP